MTKLIIDQALLDIDLSNQPEIDAVFFQKINTALNDIKQRLSSFSTFDSQSTISKDQNTVTYLNPEFSTEFGEYKLSGTYKGTLNENSLSYTSKYSQISIETDEGSYQLYGSVIASTDKSGQPTYNLALNKIIYSDLSDNVVNFSCDIKYKGSGIIKDSSYTFKINNIETINQDIDIKYKTNISYVSSSDSFVGSISDINLVSASKNLSSVSTSIPINYSVTDNTSLTETPFSSDSADLNSFLPYLLYGNDTLYINQDDIIDFEVNAGAGNDIVYGNIYDDSINGGLGNDTINAGAGNDIINGGGGNDILLGGSGDDTFILDINDFISFNKYGTPYYTKSQVSILDFDSRFDSIQFSGFSTNEPDSLNISEYSNMLQAKANEAELFYLAGKIYYNIGNDITGHYKAIPIITLTGNIYSEINLSY